MKKERLYLGILLFLLGFLGILSLLTMNIPLPDEALVLLQDQFTPTQIKFLTLINPTIFLIVAVTLGIFTYDKVSLEVPIINSVIDKTRNYRLTSILKYGVIGGVICGIILLLTGVVFSPILPLEFKELEDNLKPSISARFLYGGITEEILTRFGLMTFVIWIISKILVTKKSKIYWLGITISAILFALGHFPIAYQAVSNPSTILLSYILIGNSIGGIFFGWLYWKKGLEAAIIAHIFTHVILIMGEELIHFG